MRIDLKGRVVLLTGATGGIGEAVAKSLAECNATVAVHFNRNAARAKKLAKDIGNNSKPFRADLSNPKNCSILFKGILDTYGRVDVLINNAGLYHFSPITKKTDEWLSDWNTTIAIGLTSVAVLCREAIVHFRRKSGGRIINVASRAAFRGDFADYWAYAAAKGGMVALSRTIARAYGRENIKSFVIAPGFVRTKMTEEYFKEHGEEGVLAEIALKKLTRPEDVAPTITFLASGQMDHATGCTIDINAGSYIR